MIVNMENGTSYQITLAEEDILPAWNLASNLGEYGVMSIVDSATNLTYFIASDYVSSIVFEKFERAIAAKQSYFQEQYNTTSEEVNLTQYQFNQYQY